MAALHSMWDLSSLTRVWTLALGSESRVLTTGPPRNSLQIFLWILLLWIVPHHPRPTLPGAKWQGFVLISPKQQIQVQRCGFLIKVLWKTLWKLMGLIEASGDLDSTCLIYIIHERYYSCSIKHSFMNISFTKRRLQDICFCRASWLVLRTHFFITTINYVIWEYFLHYKDFVKIRKNNPSKFFYGYQQTNSKVYM